MVVQAGSAGISASGRALGLGFTPREEDSRRTRQVSGLGDIGAEQGIMGVEPGAQAEHKSHHNLVKGRAASLTGAESPEPLARLLLWK